MKIEDYLPSDLLRPFIKNYRVIESQEELLNRILPGTSIVMTFMFKGKLSYLADNLKDDLPISGLIGLRKTSKLVHYSNNIGYILVVFKELGARAFFKEPLHELFEENVSIDNFITKQRMVNIEEQLAQTQNNSNRIAIIEQFLLSRLCEHKQDKLVQTAIQKIYSSNGIIKIKELAETLYISNDAFEKRFRKIIRTSPKHFSSIIRMTSIVNQKQQKQSLMEIAFDAGYYDQPHFNKEFKLFTGQSPTDFLKSPIPCKINDFLQ